MKQKLTFLITAMVMMFAMMGNVWGQNSETVTFAYNDGITTNMTGGNDAALLGLNESDWSIIGDKGGNTNFPGLNKGHYIAIYFNATQSNSITVTNLHGYTISSIAITYTSEQYSNGNILVDNVPTESQSHSGTTYNYEIGKSSFVITNGNSTNVQVRISSVEMTYISNGTPTPSISVNTESIDLGDVAINETATATFTDSQENLTSNISLGAANGDLDIESILAGAATTTVTYSFIPTAVSTISDVITISCDDLTSDITINVTGNAYDPSQVDNFELFTGNLVEGDYVIYYSENALKNTLANDRLQNGSVTIADGIIENPNASVVWHIAPEGNYWTIYSTAISKYAAGTTTKNKATLIDDVTDYAKWTVTQSNGTYEFVNLGRENGGSDSGNKYLRNNGTNGWACYASTTGGALTLYKKSEGAPTPTVATPTFNPEGSSFTETQSVSITCATEGATIYYTLDGTEPTNESTLYSQPISVSVTTTIKAIATKEGMNNSPVATATYTKIEALTTMDAIFTKATEVEGTATDVIVTFNDWVVSGVKPGSNSNSSNTAYVTDGTNGLVIYSNGHGFEVGDKLNGTVACQIQLFNGSAELKNVTSTSTGLTVTKDGVITPQVVNIADLSGANTGAVIIVNNVRYNNSQELTDQASNIIKPYNSLYSEMVFNIGQVYNVTGVYLQYNSIKEILPRSADDIAPVAATEYNITIADGITNGTVTASASQAAAGVEITLTITPGEHYELASLTVNETTSGIAVTITDNKFTMPAADVTVSATFTLKALHTVTYKSLGNTLGTEQVYDGEQLASIPTDITAPEGWTFAGWTTQDVDNSTEAPTLFNTGAAVTSDLALNALFTRSEGGSENGWLETALDAVTATDVIVIVGNNGNTYAMSNDKGTGSAPTAVPVTITGSQLTGEIEDNIKWNVSGNATNGYTFLNYNDNEKWLYCTNTNNGVRVGTGEAKAMTVTDGYLTAPTGSPRYIGIYNSADWRCYDNTGGNIANQTFAYYKLVTGTVYYTTVEPAPAPTTFSITYHCNEATSGCPEDVSDVTSLPDPLPSDIAKTGHTFGGWFTDESCTMAAVAGATLTANAHLYAKWTAEQYTITYKDQNDAEFSGTHEEGYPTTHTYGTATTLKSATKEGFSFNGWFTTADCTGTAITELEATGYTADITLYAKWTENGGSGSNEVTDILNRELTGVTGSGYIDWSGKTSVSSAVYAGNSAGGNEAIQIRSKNNESGIVTTTSGGLLRKVAVVWESHTTAGRTLNVYGSHNAYTDASDLYSSSTQGTLLGTIVMGTSTELTVSDDYEYVGLRSNADAMYLTSISITYEVGATPTPTVATPTFSPEGGVYTETQNVTISCATEGADIYYTLDGTEPTNESNLYTDPISVSATTTIKAIATKEGMNNSAVATVTYTIEDPNAPGSINNPYTVAQALTHLGENGKYVLGVISSITEVSTQYGNATYNISDNGLPTDDQLLIYRGKYLDNVDFTSEDQIQVGDIVKVFGNLILYNDETPEMNSGNYIVAITHPAVPTITATPSSLELDNEEHDGYITISYDNFEPEIGVVEFFETEDCSGNAVEPDWILADFDNENTTSIYYTIGENTSTESRSTFMKATLMDEEENELSVVISISQEGYIPTVLYSYSINGVEGETHELILGQSVVLPSSADLNERFTFAGWTTVPTAVSNPMAAGKSVQLNDEVTVFYAVYDKGEAQTPPTPPTPPTILTATLSPEDIDGSELAVGSYGNVTITNQYGDWNCSAQKQDGKIQLRKANLPNQPESYIQIPTLDGIITSVVLNGTYNGSGNAYAGTAYLRNDADQNADAIASAQSDEEGNITLTPSDDCSTAYIMSSGACRITSIDVNYTTATRGSNAERYIRVFLDETAENSVNIIGPSIIPADNTLTMGSYSLTNGTAANLIIEEGAQLSHGNDGVAATVKKDITAFSTEADGWYLIASPINGNISTSDVAGLAGETYDLYSLGMTPGEEWQINKGESAVMANGQGYLYARNADVTIDFAGTLTASANAISVDLNYNTTTPDNSFTLVGNPFTCNATVNMSYYVLEGNEWIEKAATEPVAPCAAILVKATAANQSVTFTAVQPQ